MKYWLFGNVAFTLWAFVYMHLVLEGVMEAGGSGGVERVVGAYGCTGLFLWLTYAIVRVVKDGDA